MPVILVAAIAANVLPNTTHAEGGAAHGALPASGAGDGFAQLLAALSAGTPDATATPQAAPSGASTNAVNNFKALLSSGTADAQAHSSPGGSARLAALDATLPKGAKQSSALLTDSAPGQASGDTATTATTAPTGKDASAATDPNNLAAQLVIVPNNTLPKATTPAPKPQQDALDALSSDAANTSTPATGQTPADALAAAQMTDQAASGIVPNGTTTKPARDTKADASAAAPDSIKTQSQASTAGALAALSNASTRNFTDPQTSIAHAPPAHGPGGQKDSNGSANSGSSNQQNNGHPQNATVIAASDARTATANAAPPPAAVAPQLDPGHRRGTGRWRVDRGHERRGTERPACLGNRIPVTLQVAPASPNAVLDTNALAVSIATKSKDGSRQFDIRLDPAELGRVDVRITVDESERRRRLCRLKSPRRSSSCRKTPRISRRRSKMPASIFENGLNFSLKGQQQQGGNGNAPSPRGRTLSVTAVAAVDATPSTTSMSGVSASDTRLDIRV